MSAAALQAENVSVRLGGALIVDRVGLTLNTGQLVAHDQQTLRCGEREEGGDLLDRYIILPQPRLLRLLIGVDDPLRRRRGRAPLVSGLPKFLFPYGLGRFIELGSDPPFSELVWEIPDHPTLELGQHVPHQRIGARALAVSGVADDPHP